VSGEVIIKTPEQLKKIVDNVGTKTITNAELFEVLGYVVKHFDSMNLERMRTTLTNILETSKNERRIC